MEGLARLELEVLEMNYYNVSKIFEYLKTRKDLYEKFNNQEKSIRQMYKYICEKASRLKQDNVAMVDDKVVYLWAITYFNKSNEELGLNKKPTPTNKTIEKNTEIKKEEKKIEENKTENNQITLF